MSPRTLSSSIVLFVHTLLRAMKEIIKADVLFYINQKRKIRIYVVVAHYRCRTISTRGDYLLINLPKREARFSFVPRVYCACVTFICAHSTNFVI